jgi:single-stranded DNA-binding protein
MDLNMVVLSGTVDELETKVIGDRGTPLTDFRITSLDTDDPSGKYGQIKCQAWGEELSRNASMLAVGDRVLIQGRLSTRTYETQYGARSATSLLVNRISFVPIVDSKTAVAAKADSLDDLPF